MPTTQPAARAKDIDEFLAKLSPDKRAALQKLRANIQAAAPAAEECISYGVPAFRLHGKFFVGFGTSARQCSFYPGATVQRFKRELASYGTSKGTIRFPPDQPLPTSLVRKLIQARLAECAP